MLKQAVVSSNIAEAGFSRGALFLKFHSGVAYRYDKVPYEIFDKLTTAESVGNFFSRHVKGKYRYERLEKDPFKRGTDNGQLRRATDKR